MDIETDQLRSIVNEVQEISVNHGLHNDNDSSPSPSVPNETFQLIFSIIYDVLNRLRSISQVETVLLESGGNSATHHIRGIESSLADVLEILARIRTNIVNERNRADEVINYLRKKNLTSSADPCVSLMEQLKKLQDLYASLKARYDSVNGELLIQHEELSDKDNDIAELSRKLSLCCAALENTRHNLLSFENNSKRKACEAAAAQEKCGELGRYADVAIEQVSAISHERDQAHRLIDHLQVKITSLENEVISLSSQLKECENQRAGLLMENDSLNAKMAMALQKEQETEVNIAKIMEECSERVLVEVGMVKDSMQQDIHMHKEEVDKLNVELTQWRLKYEQLQRDYRNIDSMYEKLTTNVENSAQQEGIEKAEAVRRAAAAECARDEALFAKKQLLLKVEKLELALSKLTERCGDDMNERNVRINELQRQLKAINEESVRWAKDKRELEKELNEAKERCIEIEMQYRFKVIAAEENARTTQLACDTKITAADEAHKKMVNNLSRELNSRQSIINRMLDDNKKRCYDLEEKVENIQQQLREEQSRNRELTKVRADQARRIASLENHITQINRHSVKIAA